MKTGYVYVIALNGRIFGRLGRILRLGVSLRHPAERVAALRRGRWRARRPVLVGFEFAEDLIGARAVAKAAMKPMRLSAQGRTFWGGKARAIAALKEAAHRQEALRKGRFHPQSGLLSDPEIELAGPIQALSASIAQVLASEVHRDLQKLDVFLHPYMVGTIASIFHHAQPRTKIPDEYFPEILREIAWRTWKCRLKAAAFVRMSHRTRQDQTYLELARYRFETALKDKSGSQFAPAQLAAFLRQPAQHLRETVTTYAQALERSATVRARKALFAAGRLLLAIAAIFLCDSLASGGGAQDWLSALLVLFVTGIAILTFNLYEAPDLTRGVGIVPVSELRAELARLRQGLRSRARAAA